MLRYALRGQMCGGFGHRFCHRRSRRKIADLGCVIALRIAAECQHLNALKLRGRRF